MNEPDFSGVSHQRLSTIAVIGGGGAMGTMLRERLAVLGKTALCLERPLAGAEFERAMAQADMVILSVPATAMEETVAACAPFMRPGAVLSDVTSVKMVPMDVMLAGYDGPVIGTHPLFGPVIPEGFTPRVAVTPGPGADPGPLCALLAAMGFVPFLAEARDHDRAMAFVQGLNFTSTVAHLAAMRQVKDIENYVTPSFLRRLESSRKMLTQDQQLFETISEANPLLQETVRQFTQFLNIAAGGDLDLLADHARWWWRNDE
ncbi:MAG: prephenate dehydrogenase/arogenate dehydrogenase family protein [Desulfovibrionaceae bacterium]